MRLFCILLIISGCAGNNIDFDKVDSDSHPIISGTAAGDHPEHMAVVGLHEFSDSYGGIYPLPFCTGTLISDTVVLTAAHCLDVGNTNAPVYKAIDPGQLFVYVGDNPTALDENGEYDLYSNMYVVSETLMNPYYSKFSLKNDIGLIRLDEPTPYSVPYMTSQDGFTLSDIGVNLNLVGFGQNVVNGSYGVKLQANVPLTGMDNFVIEHAHIPQGICFGDSGGPAFITRDGINYMVGGVASYVMPPYCESTGAHTRVDKYEVFIDSFMNPVVSPTCELSLVGDSCYVDSDCCSGKCKGPAESKTCK